MGDGRFPRCAWTRIDQQVYLSISNPNRRSQPRSRRTKESALASEREDCHCYPSYRIASKNFYRRRAENSFSYLCDPNRYFGSSPFPSRWCSVFSRLSSKNDPADEGGRRRSSDPPSPPSRRSTPRRSRRGCDRIDRRVARRSRSRPSSGAANSVRRRPAVESRRIASSAWLRSACDDTLCSRDSIYLLSDAPNLRGIRSGATTSSVSVFSVLRGDLRSSLPIPDPRVDSAGSSGLYRDCSVQSARDRSRDSTPDADSSSMWNRLRLKPGDASLVTDCDEERTKRYSS